MQELFITCLQSFFFCTAPVLNLFFPLKGSVNPVKLLVVNKIDRPVLFGMICTFTILVLQQS
jgi:hypothetical protein